MMIDYRSDTVTKPTPGMKAAMINADVADDVYGEDPSVNQLEESAARMFEMEAAVFCPSGTMTNQVAIKCHTVPGDEVICDRDSHIYQYEGGGIAANSGAQVHLLTGNRGRITAQQVQTAINADDVHKAVSRLVSLENTANRGGGACYDFGEIQAIRRVCDENNLSLHLDGARLFNALVAKQEQASSYGKLFDSISICLSKGLGAPVGSLLLGRHDFIKKARRVRKLFGGGMRQAGYLAAAGNYALQNHVERLQQDHDHAKALAQTLAEQPFVDEVLPVETNIIIFSVAGDTNPKRLASTMKEQGILWYAISPTQVRIVTHLDISAAMVDQTIEAIRRIGTQSSF